MVVTCRTALSALSMIKETFDPSSICVAKKQEKKCQQQRIFGHKKQLYEEPVLQLMRINVVH